MAAPTIRQSTFLAGTALTATGTATLPAWGTATLTGSRVIVFWGVTANQNDGIAGTATVGTATVTLGTVATRQATSHDAVKLSYWQALGLNGTAAVPTIVYSGLPGTAIYYWASAHEVTGAGTGLLDGVAVTGTGSGNSFTIGPAGPTTLPEVLWLSASATPNNTVTSIHTGSMFSQVLAGSTGTAYNQSQVTALIGKYAQSVAGTASMTVDVAGTATRQYAGVILAIPGTVTSAGGGGGTAAAGPQQFPLGPPDMTGATVLDDPNHLAAWTPTDPSLPAGSGLKNGVDYIVNCPVLRTKNIKIIGGRNVYVPSLLIRAPAGTAILPAMVELSGGDVGRIVHFSNVWIDPNGNQCDIFKTQSPFDGRHLQLKVVRIEKIMGRTSQTHADLLQSSGGIGNVWVEDFTGATTYDGFMLQREANGEQQTTSYPITAGSVTGSNYEFTAPNHTFTAGTAVGVWGVTPSAYNGGFTVLSVSGSGSTKKFQVKKGDSSPGTVTASGHVEGLSFAYNVGDIHFNRVNVNGFHNDLQNTPPLQCIRFGARTAPDPNSGSPGTVTGYTKQNEDQTPINSDSWAGTLNATDWYADPTGAQNLKDFVAPDGGTSTYSGIRPVQHVAAGTVPIYLDWPNYPNVGTATKLYQGAPPTGDWVVISGGFPTATYQGTASSAPPTATTNPEITPSDPVIVSTVLSVKTLGTWSNVDATTSWDVAFQKSLAGTAAYANAQSHTGFSQAQAAADTYTVGTADSGYTFRLRILANNGTIGTAFSTPTNVVTDYSPVTIQVVVE